MVFDMRDYLDRFAEVWPSQVDRLISHRLSPLLGRKVCFRVLDGPCYTVFFGDDKLEISERESASADATVTMAEDDWREVLSGQVGIMSVVFAGRCPYPKHERYVLAKLSVVLQSLATLKGERAS